MAGAPPGDREGQRQSSERPGQPPPPPIHPCWWTYRTGTTVGIRSTTTPSPQHIGPTLRPHTPLLGWSECRQGTQPSSPCHCGQCLSAIDGHEVQPRGGYRRRSRTAMISNKRRPRPADPPAHSGRLPTFETRARAARQPANAATLQRQSAPCDGNSIMQAATWRRGRQCSRSQPEVVVAVITEIHKRGLCILDDRSTIFIEGLPFLVSRSALSS